MAAFLELCCEPLYLLVLLGDEGLLPAEFQLILALQFGDRGDDFVAFILLARMGDLEV